MINLTDIEKLKEKGYYIDEKIGNGCTRNVYKVQYIPSHWPKGCREDRVIKIPKQKIPKDFISTRIMDSKRKNNESEESEFKSLIRLKHKNIAKAYDTFLINGKRINVEERVYGDNLEERVEHKKSYEKFTGFGDKIIKKEFSQILDAMVHLESKGEVYGDLKPSNIMVDYNSEIKIIDFQTAEKSKEVRENPSRGRASYAHPALLNSFLTDKPLKANSSTEVYSLGAILYHYITGKDLFNYRIVENPKGKEISIGDDKIKISILNNGKLTNKISPEEHNAFVKEKLENLSTDHNKYKKILEKSLLYHPSSNNPLGINYDPKSGRSEFKEDFDNIFNYKKRSVYDLKHKYLAYISDKNRKQVVNRRATGDKLERDRNDLRRTRQVLDTIITMASKQGVKEKDFLTKYGATLKSPKNMNWNLKENYF